MCIRDRSSSVACSSVRSIEALVSSTRAALCWVISSITRTAELTSSIERTEEQATELDRIVEVFTINARDPRDARGAAPASSRGIKGLQERVKTAAKSYLTRGNAAVEADKDWAEF